MSLNDNPESGKTRVQSPKEPNRTKELCHIHQKISQWDNKDEIRRNLCRYTDVTKHTDGNYYCLFHLPTIDKDIDRFKLKFSELFLAIKEFFVEKEKLPESEQEDAGRAVFYDFRYVWFPSAFKLSNYEFLPTEVVFSGATFASGADFDLATFMSDVDFTNTTFMSRASFKKTTFTSEALFYGAKFTSNARFLSAKFLLNTSFSSAAFISEAEFQETKFMSLANFSKTTFLLDADFNTATFMSNADFSEANFMEDADFTKVNSDKNGITIFEKTVFSKEAHFKDAEFHNDITFSRAKFGSESKVHFRRTGFANNVNFRHCTAEGYMRFSELNLEAGSKFDFQEAAFEKVARVSFHTVRLQPNWFVNIDSRKFVFTDVTWENVESKTERKLADKFKFAFECLKSGWRQIFYSNDEILNYGIKAELEHLEKRGITEQKKRLLEITCQQLAVNAEENNRYEQASKFRYMAMEMRRLESKGIWRFLNMHWFYKWSSGYGESWARAALVLIMILFVCGMFYNTPFAYFEPFEKKTERQKVQENAAENIEAPRYYQMSNSEGFIHSLYVAALQRPEPKPAADSNLTKAVIILETIFAPLQAALLALAIRRKFMR